MLRNWPAGFLSLFLATLCGPMPVAAQGSLAGSWYDATQNQLVEVDLLVDEVNRRIGELEAELKRVSDRARSDQPCANLSCEGLAAAVSRARASLEAAAAGAVLAEIGAQELARLADNQRASLENLAASRDDLARGMLVLDIAQQTAKLSAGIAAALATGDSRSIAGQVNAVTDTLLNYAANQGVNLIAQQRDAAGGLAATADPIRAAITQDLARSIGEQLTNVAVVTSAGGPVKLTLRPVASQMSLSRASEIATRVFVEALTEPFVAGVRKDFQTTLGNYRRAFEQQQDLELAAEFGKLAVSLAQTRQHHVAAAANRLVALADACVTANDQLTCAATHKTALDEARAERDTASEISRSATEDAELALSVLRVKWRSSMTAATQSHLALAAARNRLAEAERLTSNEAQIRTLASQAADADTRSKYAAELARLTELGAPSEIAKEVASLESARSRANSTSEALLAEIAVAADEVRTRNTEAEAELGEVEAAYRGAVSAAWSAFIDCTQIKVSDLAQSASPSATVVKTRLGREVDPEAVFAGLRAGLEATLTDLSKVRIAARTVEGVECSTTPVEVTSLEGCWQGRDELWLVRRLGPDTGSVTVSVNPSANGVPTYVMTGRAQDGVLDVAALDAVAVHKRISALKADNPHRFSMSLPAMQQDSGDRLHFAVEDTLMTGEMAGDRWTYLADPGYREYADLGGHAVILVGDTLHHKRVHLEKRWAARIGGIYATPSNTMEQLDAAPVGEPFALVIQAEDPCPWAHDVMTGFVSSNLKPRSVPVRFVETAQNSGLFRLVGEMPDVLPDGLSQVSLGFMGGTAEIIIEFEDMVQGPDGGETWDVRVPVASDELPEGALGDVPPQLDASDFENYRDSTAHQQLRDAYQLALDTQSDGEAGPALSEARFERHLDKARVHVAHVFGTLSQEVAPARAYIQQELAAATTTVLGTREVWEQRLLLTERLAAEFDEMQQAYEAAVAGRPSAGADQVAWETALQGETDVLRAAADRCRSLARSDDVGLAHVCASHLDGMITALERDYRYLIGAPSIAPISP